MDSILELRGYTVVIKMFFVKNLVGMYACRYNDYLNAAKEKREPLNDSQFIEYLYNRAYSILYLLRLKS